MLIGERTRSHPTVQVPPWDHLDDPTPHNMSSSSPPFPVSGVSVNFNGNASSPNGGDYSPFISEAFTALQRYLPSNEFAAAESDFAGGDELDFPFDSFCCDNFRMYEFKVRRCARGKSHDWTECPYAHPGEKARRRDPRKYGYSGTACPEFRKGACKKGDLCEFAHGVFECWLHPDRYRTQACKDGTNCRRRVCFFAHSPEQLRVLTQLSPRAAYNSESYDGSTTLRRSFDSYLSNGSFGSSPTSILMSPPASPPSDSPPLSPNSPSLGGSFNSVSELVANMRNLQVGKMKMSPPAWGVSGFGSPRCSNLRPGFCSMPSTPTRVPTRSGLGVFDLWDSNKACEEEPAMERVESGRDLRAKIYAKLSKENSLDRVNSAGSAPDVGWISELVK